MLENLIYLAILILVFYFVFNFLQSVIKTLLVVLIIFFLIVLFKTMNEPLTILDYQVYNFSIKKIK